MERIWSDFGGNTDESCIQDTKIRSIRHLLTCNFKNPQHRELRDTVI
ncbi:hypothetical protein [Paenibacillus bovis]|nr:hypothetical protein [Paenibacillus bovis]